ncbi:hypothetical protein GL218_04987 [Daldinia childiae]|uniref:uncharacterized protein n=1 Tax=Daldinia childiae TaxID=326645 RepID=UPI001448921C|nr:uncharacterized protein GL218_04987 [Daldinia childiae]KAF3060001.1 hypothetical protein GL218_04987 [Daldinia childiae]
MGDSGTVRSRLIALRLVLLVLLFANAVDAKGTATITPAPSRPTTVPIWLPNMSGEEWSQWRGSIISSNDVETVYTIFCPAERPGCTVFSTNDMPVTFTEGPATLRTANTIAGLLLHHSSHLQREHLGATRVLAVSQLDIEYYDSAVHAVRHGRGLGRADAGGRAAYEY